jgi:hypothetical protein
MRRFLVPGLRAFVLRFGARTASDCGKWRELRNLVKRNYSANVPRFFQCDKECAGVCSAICQTGFVSGISFMVDERGAKTAAVIDLSQHGRLWEDFYDTLLSESRANEPQESLSEVRRRLKLRSKANGR